MCIRDRCDMGERVAKSLMSTAFTDWIELSSEYSMAEAVSYTHLDVYKRQA